VKLAVAAVAKKDLFGVVVLAANLASSVAFDAFILLIRAALAAWLGRIRNVHRGIVIALIDSAGKLLSFCLEQLRLSWAAALFRESLLGSLELKHLFDSSVGNASAASELGGQADCLIANSLGKGEQIGKLLWQQARDVNRASAVPATNDLALLSLEGGKESLRLGNGYALVTAALRTHWRKHGWQGLYVDIRKLVVAHMAIVLNSELLRPSVTESYFLKLAA
jgi:hypothetical protein